MKTSIKIIILAVATVFAAMSCNKESAVPEPQNPVKEGETIQVNITASLGDLVAADGTKATATSVVRLTWDGSEKVQAYCGTNKISTGDGLSVTPSSNGLFASLTGTIDQGPEANGTITFVYSSGCTPNADGLTFDFSSQTADIPFIAYATLVYDGNGDIEGKMVEFKFATSVMKIAATNLSGEAITSATISGINNSVSLTPKNNGDPEIAGIGATGTDGGIINTTNLAKNSDNTRAIVTVGLVPDNTENPYRMLAFNNESKIISKGVITSTAIASNTAYTTPASLFPCGTLGDTGNEHDYVLIAGTKWATQNLAISNSGKVNWIGNGESPIQLPGSDASVQIGDFFQWAAYENFVSPNQSGSDKGLLLYKSFYHRCGADKTVTKSYFNSLKDKDYSNTYEFSWASDAPYYDISSQSYTEYIADRSKTLIPSDDVASICWGGGWRMPTSAEFRALLASTYWKYDTSDQGYYVYAPQPGDAGKKDNTGSGTYDKTGALLFFPAAGYGSGTNIDGDGFYNGPGHEGNQNSEGIYWSSTGPGANAECLNFIYHNNNGSIDLHVSTDRRYYGCSVRPVSD